MAIYLNLGDTAAINAAMEMMNRGVKGRDISLDISSHDGIVVARKHERKDEEGE